MSDGVKFVTRIIGFLAFVVGGFLAWQGIASVVNEMIPNGGPAIAALFLAFLAACGGIVWLALHHAGSTSKQSLAHSASVNQDATQGNLIAVANIPAEVFKSARAENDALYRARDADLRERENYARRRESRLDDRERVINDVARALLAKMDDAGMSIEFNNAEVQNLFAQSTVRMPESRAQSGSVTQTQTFPADDENTQSMMDDPLVYSAQLASPPMVQTDRVVSQQKNSTMSNSTKYVFSDVSRVSAKYRFEVVQLASIIVDVCYKRMGTNVRMLMAQVNCNSTRDMQEALDLLADLQFITKKDTQGKPRAWRDDPIGRPDPYATRPDASQAVNPQDTRFQAVRT